MDVEQNMANIFGVLKAPSFDDDSSGKARIWEDESPVCDRFNRKNCYDPDSLKKAFHPLGIFSKIFGLFPCYDFSFVKKQISGDSKKLKIVHILDYCYSVFLFVVLCGGAVMSSIFLPTILQKAFDSPNQSDQHLFDYHVKIALIYATIVAGVQSLFIFPMKWNSVLTFVRLISNVDKILRFDGRQEERRFARNVLFYMLGCLVFALTSFLVLFVYNNEHSCIMDYVLAPVMTMALMVLIIPTGLAIFFLNAIRLRLQHFNGKLVNFLRPWVPSYEKCTGFSDYGNELDDQAQAMDKRAMFELPQNLEKMRILYSEIATLGNCLTCIFGMHLVRDFLYSLIALTLYAYFLVLFSSTEVGIAVIYAGHAIFIILKIFVLVTFTQLIGCQVSTLEGILQRVSIRRLSDSCAIQVQAFITAAAKPPTISAAGFFVVNKALMTSIVASITTYVIIIMQFKPGRYGSSGSAPTA